MFCTNGNDAKAKIDKNKVKLIHGAKIHNRFYFKAEGMNKSPVAQDKL
jgi:hypothetical protein